MKWLPLLLLFSCQHQVDWEEPVPEKQWGPHALFIFCDARGLDYTSSTTLYRTLEKQGGRRGTDGIFGHAWVRLQSGSTIIEGGHNGEYGQLQPRYWDGVIDALAKGEQDPIKYLWEEQIDGHFQQGSGGHTATHCAVIPITKECFQEIRQFIGDYSFSTFDLQKRQCTSFVAQVAAIAGVDLEHQVVVPIDQKLRLGHRAYRLWRDPIYRKLTLSTPDILVRNRCLEPL